MKIDFDKFFIIAGPCVIEDYTHLREVASHIKFVTEGVQWILKASYDKGNRTELGSFRGPGFERGLNILSGVKNELKCPITSDVHGEDEATHAGGYLDLIQIPAFLCRQTDILVAAARTGKPVNVKKGQFISPNEIASIRNKVGRNVLITERGSQFGYGETVIDFRHLSLCDVLDVTHSVTNWEDSLNLAKAGLAAGIKGIFCEVGSTKCDEKRSIPLNEFEGFFNELRDFYKRIS